MQCNKTATKNTNDRSHCEVLRPQTRTGSEDHQAQRDSRTIRHISLCRMTKYPSEEGRNRKHGDFCSYTHDIHIPICLKKTGIASDTTFLRIAWLLCKWTLNKLGVWSIHKIPRVVQFVSRTVYNIQNRSTCIESNKRLSGSACYIIWTNQWYQSLYAMIR
jgi:hypothetical protein